MPSPRDVAGGKAYFITNGEPVVLWDWINQLLRGLGRPEITKHISLHAAYRIGGSAGNALAHAAASQANRR